jgi:hypothetical protein
MVPPELTSNGPNLEIERFTLAFAGSRTTKTAEAKPTPLLSIVCTVHVPT